MIGLAKEQNRIYYLETPSESFVSFLLEHHLLNKEKFGFIIVGLDIHHFELLSFCSLSYLVN